VLTIYVGDDQTDEDAFSVLKAAEDISVLVGDGNQNPTITMSYLNKHKLT
jgi:trehalose-6-phosphatase